MLDQYWSFMLNCHFGLQYVQRHRRANWKLERFLDIFLAIASTGSLAVLLAWDKAQIASTIIITVSQIFSSIRPYLPSGRRVEALAGIVSLMSKEYNKIENDYRSLCLKKATEEDIADLLHSHTNTWRELDTEVGDLMLSHKEKYIKYATNESAMYFKLMFGAECAEKESKENK